jgi:hypothetical protein
MGSIEVFWDNDARSIIYMVFEGHWTWDDFYAADRQVIEMEKDGPERIDVIVDLRRSAGLPPNTLLHVKNIADKQSAKMGLNVLVTTSPLIHSLYNVGARFYNRIGHYFCLAETPEDARRIIEETRQLARAE